MTKLPFMQFYPADWIQDTQILDSRSKAAWIDILCQLWISENPGERTWNMHSFTTLLRLQYDEDIESVVADLDRVGEVMLEDSDRNEVDSPLKAAFITIKSRRIMRDVERLSGLKDKHKRYNDKRATKKRPHNDQETTSIYQKSEVRSQKSEDKIKDQVKPPADPVDKSKEKEKAEIAWTRDLHTMWLQVQQMAKRQPERFDKTLGAWVGAMLQKRWQPVEIKTALMDFVRFEDSNSQIAEWYPYLNVILQKTRTKAVQGESEQHKDYDPQGIDVILKGMGLNK